MRSRLVSLGCLLAAAVGASASADTTPDASTSVDDPAAWLSARGVKDPAKQLGDACCCVEVIVGAASEHALRCSEATPAGVEESADIAVSEIIRVVRSHKAVKVLEV